MSALDLDAIEARAKRDVLTCDECDAPATRVCNASECGATRCDAHAIEHSGHCDHRWYPRRSLAADVLALVALARAPRRHGDAVSAIDESVCRCEREPAWCFVHRRWGRALSSPPTRMELIEQVRGLTTTVEAQAAEIERLRAFLPAETVVPCPACGVDITADLVDGAYVTRQHSRRAPKTVGLGDIVWCDGGVVRTVAR